MKIKEIQLNGTCENNEITDEKDYIVMIYGERFFGKFEQQWYGWNFSDWGTSGVQLSSIDKVCEVVDWGVLA